MHALLLALALAAPPATLDEKIAAALKTHPDIKAAEAKKLLAEAELEQARLDITQKVTSAVARIELAKAHLIQAEEDVVIAEKILKLGSSVSEIEKSRYQAVRPALIAAKANLAAAELELQQLVGPAVKAEAKPVDKSGPLRADPPLKLPSGPVAEKLENALRMAFKLDFKDIEVKKAFEGLMTAAKLDDVPVRGMKMLGGDILKNPPKFDKLTGQNTFDGWVELFIDELNGNNQGGLPEQQHGKYEVYVREYGLLVEKVTSAPSDAMTLTQFARAVRAKPR